MSDPIAVHRALLERWRKIMDLVGPGPIDPHFEDAAGAVAGLDVRGTWADLGSGAGFPGIQLAACAPEAEVLLVESRMKRATFLERVVAEAGLHNARVRRLRAEDLPAASLDGVIARAFMPPEDYLALARPLLRPGGVAVVLLGDRDWTPPSGWKVRSEHRYAVPDGHRRRWVLQPDSSEPTPWSGR